MTPPIKPSFVADPVFVAKLRQAREELAKEVTEVTNLKKRQRDQQSELLQLIQTHREKLREQRRQLESALARPSANHVLSRVNAVLNSPSDTQSVDFNALFLDSRVYYCVFFFVFGTGLFFEYSCCFGKFLLFWKILVFMFVNFSILFVPFGCFR